MITRQIICHKLVIGPSVERAYKSMDGHILLWFMPDGNDYYVISLNDEDANGGEYTESMRMFVADEAFLK